MIVLSGHNLELRPAEGKDLQGILSLLQRCSLPGAGVEQHLGGFIVALDPEGSIVGTIGLEQYGDGTGLLRSAAVDASLRSIGLGSELYRRIIDRAREQNMRRVVLLTTTAEPYFERKGFRTIDRADVTGPVTQSAEFRDACPASAICMELRDVDGAEHSMEGLR